jgi:teichuronic acid biosynthesis glycosyltransferase TuaG
MSLSSSTVRTATDSPLLSIVTPTYNSMRFFHETTESVLALVEVDYEWIIVDDLSSDGTAAFVADLAATEPRVRFLPNDRRAGRASTNYLRGLECARGRYILFLDHDDVLSANGIQAALASLEGSLDVHVAISRVDYMDENSHVYKTKSIPFASYGSVLGRRQMFWTVFLSPTYPLKQGAVVVRRALFAKTGPVFDFHLVLAATQFTDFALIPIIGLRYRNVMGSTSARRIKEIDSFWIYPAMVYLPNNRYFGLAYVFTAYKVLVGCCKVIYSIFTPNRI